MSSKKKQYSPQFKAKVALEAIRGEKTVPELASQYQIHPTVINGWKRKLLEDANQIFEVESKGLKVKEDDQGQINELYRQIGQLKVERDFLACIIHEAKNRSYKGRKLASACSEVKRGVKSYQYRP
jgi:transposase-like protein